MKEKMREALVWGIFSKVGQEKRVAAKIGEVIFDVYELAKYGLLKDIDIDTEVFRKDFLNDFISLGKDITNQVRLKIESIADFEGLLTYSSREVNLHLPIRIGDYTDFYSSEQHAYNVGVMFRDPTNALLPNWKHLPVGYHGRASSIFTSGVNFHRPKGQINASDTTLPTFSPTKRLDIELEMATIIGQSTEIGDSVDVNEAEDYIFGFALFNDWSARDIQRWEYVPLGPFLAKNFFSSMAHWIVPIEVLEPFKVEPEDQIPEVLPYLHQKERHNFDVTLEVWLMPNGSSEAYKISSSNFKNMYWTAAQQIAHHTVNGCNINVGDVMASGTISGKTPDSYGSLLELSWGGKTPIQLPNGETRSFLEDGDTVILKGYAIKDDYKVDFGEVRTTVLSSK
jgi:fumarylacetoacetase